MANFTLDGTSLREYPSNKKVAELKGNDLVAYPSNRKIAVIRGDDIYEHPSNRKIAAVKGDTVKDASGRTIVSMKEIAKGIRNARGGASLAAFWLCFVR